MGKIAAGFLCVLVVVTLLSNVESGQGDKFLQLTRRSIKEQKLLHDKLKDFIENKPAQIEITEKNGKPTISFVGDEVKKMKLKEVFTMLQNFPQIFPKDARHQHFDLKIGGHSIQFRLQHNIGQGQIYLYKFGSGIPHGLVRYQEDIARVLDKDPSKVREIARQMLQSLEEPLDSQTQTHWTETDSKTIERMQLLMILSQVVESARPPDSYFKHVESIISEAVDVELESAKNKWKDAINEVLEGEKNTLSKDKINVLKTNLLTDPMQLLSAVRKIVTEKEQNNVFLDLLPQDLSDRVKMELLSRAKTVDRSARKEAVGVFQVDMIDYKPKLGRVPGTEVVMRNLLEKMVNGEIETFRQLFDKEHFVLAPSGGLQKGREMWFPLLEGYTFEELSNDGNTGRSTDAVCRV